MRATTDPEALLIEWRTLLAKALARPVTDEEARKWAGRIVRLVRPEWQPGDVMGHRAWQTVGMYYGIAKRCLQRVAEGKPWPPHAQRKRGQFRDEPIVYYKQVSALFHHAIPSSRRTLKLRMHGVPQAPTSRYTLSQ